MTNETQFLVSASISSVVIRYCRKRTAEISSCYSVSYPLKKFSLRWIYAFSYLFLDDMFHARKPMQHSLHLSKNGNT